MWKVFNFKTDKAWRRNIPVLCLLALTVSTISIGVFASHALQSESTPLEAKEAPLSTSSPSPSSNPSANSTVSPTSTPSPTASPTSNPTPTPNASPSPSPTVEVTLTPSALLLEGGAKWAAKNSSGSALLISWKDHWSAHHLTDGTDWGPWPAESNIDNSRSSIAQILGQAGFEVNFAGDIPQNLSNYNLVVVEAYWAVEPRHNALFRDYLANGGGIVILGGAPCYLSVYCKDWWPYRAGNWSEGGGTNLTSLQDWFGCQYYMNTGGTARVTVNNPFGTALLANATLVTTEGYSAAAVSTPSNSTQVIATWAPVYSMYLFTSDYPLLASDYTEPYSIFAFTHEYGEGRVYYQASY